jgi:hypothetical protein
VSLVDALMTALGTPHLSGALCRGRHELFDLNDRVPPTVALRMCGRCPALADCKEWVDSLPRRKQPTGVVAGQVIRPLAPRKLPVQRRATNSSARHRRN